MRALGHQSDVVIQEFVLVRPSFRKDDLDSLLLTEAAGTTTKGATGADAINVLDQRWDEHGLGDGDPARFAGSSNLEMLDKMAG